MKNFKLLELRGGALSANRGQEGRTSGRLFNRHPELVSESL